MCNTILSNSKDNVLRISSFNALVEKNVRENEIRHTGIMIEKDEKIVSWVRILYITRSHYKIWNKGKAASPKKRELLIIIGRNSSFFIQAVKYSFYHKLEN